MLSCYDTVNDNKVNTNLIFRLLNDIINSVEEYMYKLRNGVLLLDAIDLLCISSLSGCIIAFLFNKYKDNKCADPIVKDNKWADPVVENNKWTDPIVKELRNTSPLIMLSRSKKILRFPLVRGGNDIQVFYLFIQSRKLARALFLLWNARENQRRLKLLQVILFMSNKFLFTNTGFIFGSAVSTNLSYTQIILIMFPGTLSGFLVSSLLTFPLILSVLPIAIMMGRFSVQDIVDSHEHCRVLCKAAESYHNKKLVLEMKNSEKLLPPLKCVEQRVSLVERHRLIEIVKNNKSKARIKHFSEFLKGFPECDATKEDVYEEIVKNLHKISIRGDN